MTTSPELLFGFKAYGMKIFLFCIRLLIVLFCAYFSYLICGLATLKLESLELAFLTGIHCLIFVFFALWSLPDILANYILITNIEMMKDQELVEKVISKQIEAQNLRNKRIMKGLRVILRDGAKI